MQRYQIQYIFIIYILTFTMAVYVSFIVGGNLGARGKPHPLASTWKLTCITTHERSSQTAAQPQDEHTPKTSIMPFHYVFTFSYHQNCLFSKSVHCLSLSFFDTLGNSVKNSMKDKTNALAYIHMLISEILFYTVCISDAEKLRMKTNVSVITRIHVSD